MTGGVAIDVVISLIFIFLLYSLLATVIVEIISTWLNLRAKNLKKAIQRMLEDELSIDWLSLISNFRKKKLWQFLSKKNETITTSFYKRPSIKYLAQKNRKPSYLSPQAFSKTVVDMLKANGKNGTTDLEKINAGLENNTFGVETGAYIKSLLDDAQNDLVKFKAYLETWFNDTMERATGWYKKRMQVILLFVGLGIAIMFNANVTDMVKVLSTDKNSREQLVSMANAYVENNKIEFDKNTTSDTLLNKKLDSLLQVKKDIQKDINEVNSILGLGWIFPDSLRAVKWRGADELKKTQHILYHAKDSFLVDFGDQRIAKNVKYYSILSSQEESSLPIFYASFDHLNYIWDNFFGYLLLALAISMGAPFWFDMLNKLIKLRSSVQQDTSQQSKQSNKNGNEGENIPVTKRVG